MDRTDSLFSPSSPYQDDHLASWSASASQTAARVLRSFSGTSLPLKTKETCLQPISTPYKLGVCGTRCHRKQRLIGTGLKKGYWNEPQRGALLLAIRRERPGPVCLWKASRPGVPHGLLGRGVPQAFSSRFLSLFPQLHPDSDPANPDLHSQFVKLSEAYRVLSKESSRKHYDSLRAARAQAAWPASGSHGSRPKRKPFDFADFGAR